MALLNTFDSSTTTAVLARLEKLNSESTPEWGKMNAGQMLAHLNVAYDMVYNPENFKRPNWLLRKVISLMAKKQVVSDKPYPKNGSTAPDFLIKDEKDFNAEKAKLIENIKTTEAKGTTYFEGKESFSFGVLTIQEWSNLFYKHMDHHFTQFGV